MADLLPATWRLLMDGPADGATNMAVDEAILQAVVEGSSPPTLRFYTWSPPCLSLGRNQPLADADPEACRAAGVDLVRRPSGGRAILHTDELTYSIALCQDDPRAVGGVLEVYHLLSEGLLDGLHHLGVPAVQAMGRLRPGDETAAICFETPSQYEIVVEGRKLVGSAQWRSQGGVLQHGTLPLYGDLARIVHYLAFSEQEREIQKRAVRARATTLEEVMGRAPAFAEVANALAESLARTLNLTLHPLGLDPRERQAAADLRRTRYAAADWTGRH